MTITTAYTARRTVPLRWVDRVWVRDVVGDMPPDSAWLRARLHNVRRLVARTTGGSSKLVNSCRVTPARAS